MIAANELRIGNWVKRLNESNTLCVSMIDSSNDVRFEGLDEHIFDLEDHGIEPIPLTPEILEKCGFKHGQHEGYSVWYKDDITIMVDRMEYQLCNEDAHEGFLYKIGKLIKYLHQLQNLYHALTGEDLNVQL